MAFSLTESLCDAYEPTHTSIHLINLDSGAARSPTQNDTWLYLPEMVSADPIPTALPQTRFVFSVKQGEDGTFKVFDLPPYAP